ncbi:uncharacterized protein LOC119082125 [Bradysia coprophila]|uniref:uncharacterized protein LOC119082125 n=1 Tax=Bradysia coprophila TaxID=38358 RepID=UPI00187DD31B|nr:uncharacterized protein LOC119082125 [Bradysia coprophila]
MVGTPLAIPKRKLATIIAILKSRRLLSDHSEVLEECLSNDCKESESWVHKYSNGISCSLLVTSSILTLKFVSKRIGVALCTISSGYAIMCLAKLVSYGQLWFLHNSIERLLNDIDEFDACMRRSISYFRENAFFQSTHQSGGMSTSSKELTACTTSLITIVESIRDVVVSLEQMVVLSKVDDLFSPLEDLSEYLEKSSNEATVSNLKDLYNIFLYAQSHLLTRLSLLLIYNGQSQLLPKAMCSALSRAMNDEICRENSRYEQLTSSAPTDTNHRSANTIDHVAMEPISNLKGYSISASSKILAIASECRRIDGIIQSVHKLNEDELTGLMPSIIQIENAFNVCQSEYQRFVVAYCKAMNVNYTDHCTDRPDINGDSEFTAENEALHLKFKEIEPDEEEFFTSTERTSDDESKESNRNRRGWDDELAEKNIKVVKQRFKPVLAQLKGKIEPIAASLRERERNHLLAKGIDPSEFVDCNKLNEGFRSCSDSDDDDGEDSVRHKKPNRFDEMRKFLEGKSQISLIPMRSANDNFLNEDILE